MNFIEKSADWAQKSHLGGDIVRVKMIPPDNVRTTALHDGWRDFWKFRGQVGIFRDIGVATGT